MSFPQPFYRWRPHPWHGLDVGPKPPHVVHAYIELTPFDMMKYEIDKVTGYLRVDRPQRTSSHPPMLYGFIPRTYCGSNVQSLAPNSSRGDDDPLDVCVISERPINRSEVIVGARVLGGIQMIDGGEADDKIIAVLENDAFWQNAQDIDDLPEPLIERMRHYFETYKLVPGKPADISIDRIYDREYAHKVIEASMRDYQDEFGG